MSFRNLKEIVEAGRAVRSNVATGIRSKLADGTQHSASIPGDVDDVSAENLAATVAARGASESIKAETGIKSRTVTIKSELTATDATGDYLLAVLNSVPELLEV